MSDSFDIPYLARIGKFKSIKRIILKNPLHPIDNCDRFKKTGLLYAAENNDIEMLKFFLDNGADIDNTDRDGNNALALAVKFDSEVTANYLIDLGMDVNIQINHQPLLHCAILNENAPLSYKILKAGADPTEVNYKGLDAYQLAQLKLEQCEVNKFEKILKKLQWI